MKYMGSKARIAKYIVPIIQKYIDDHHITTYWEPFGGLNVIDKIQCDAKYASDNNKYLIAMFEYFLEHPEALTAQTRCPREEYEKVKQCWKAQSDEFPDWYLGYIGFCASYGGRFFDGGYGAERPARNYFGEASRNILKQLPKLKDVRLLWGDYRTVAVPLDEKTLIYCDIPYIGTRQYSTSVGFDYAAFYDWCREKAQEHIVLISEVEMPDDFEIIWQHDLNCSLQIGEHLKRSEKLWLYKGGIR